MSGSNPSRRSGADSVKNGIVCSGILVSLANGILVEDLVSFERDGSAEIRWDFGVVRARWICRDASSRAGAIRVRGGKRENTRKTLRLRGGKREGTSVNGNGSRVRGGKRSCERIP